MDINLQRFVEIGTTVISSTYISISIHMKRNYRAVFGFTPHACSAIWGLIKFFIPDNCTPRHLLCDSIFLPGYHKEPFNSALVLTHPKNFENGYGLLLMLFPRNDWSVFLNLFNYSFKMILIVIMLSNHPCRLIGTSVQMVKI